MLKRFFDAGNPLMQALSVAADLLMLNLLTLLCCLPVVTAGAALTALNDMCIRIIRGEDNYILKPFFRSFVSNLKLGSIMGLLFMLAGGLVWLDYRLAELYFPPLRITAAAVGLIVLAVALYAFALLARYENTLRKTLKNAATLAVAFFPRTLGMMVCVVGLALLCLNFLNFALPILIMFGLSLPCYVCLLLLNGVFEKLEQKEENKEE